MSPEPLPGAAAAAKRVTFFGMVGPGLLLAATGVGGGDLATASFVGSMLGASVLWAVVVGALLKFVVTEGLARWQLATGETFIEGAVRRLGRGVLWVFLPYLLLWSFFVAAAQMSATGVTLHAMLPVFEDPADAKLCFGIAAGLSGLALVWRGGYRLFGQLMRICIGLMFFTVITTAALLWPGWEEVARGFLVPRLPRGEGLIWTVALIGGVGGTLTVLSYGYWIREEGRHSQADLRACRIDLACGYAMTAIFGICMIIVGNTITVQGEGTGLLISLSDRLGERWGPAGKWLFLIGTFGTVYSSLLGVWQAVPYLFADCWRLLRGHERIGTHETVSTDAPPYRVYLVLIALVPMIGLLISFREVQKIYTVVGALFFPLLALALLVFNGRTAWVGTQFRNRPLTVVALLGVLALFAWIAIAGIKVT